jgi:hypothetical protein
MTVNYIAPDLKEGSEPWTLIDAECAKIVAARPGLARPEYRACLINAAIAQCRHKFLPPRK